MGFTLSYQWKYWGIKLNLSVLQHKMVTIDSDFALINNSYLFTWLVFYVLCPNISPTRWCIMMGKKTGSGRGIPGDYLQVAVRHSHIQPVRNPEWSENSVNSQWNLLLKITDWTYHHTQWYTRIPFSTIFLHITNIYKTYHEWWNNSTTKKGIFEKQINVSLKM